MTVRAIVFTPYQSFERRYLMAAQMAGMQLHASPDLADFSSQLYRDNEAIGILWSMGGTSAAETIRRLREGNVFNRLIALIHYLDTAPHLRAQARGDALSAGCDDAQASDIDPAELAARLKVIAERVGYVDHLQLRFAGCRFLPDSGLIAGPEVSTHATITEGRLLTHLARHEGATRSKQELMDALYGYDDA
ncbi:response regulator transcription factor, partial [Mesorhizobium sp. Z1-4]|uniref:response regulator transcription factor n=1 Tax=Mesorhizobium sp. Z1-4 TaxID=2448478 RepID=UPI0013E0AD48